LGLLERSLITLSRGETKILAKQDFQAKEIIVAIMLENKAPNPIAVSCLKVAFDFFLRVME
jgi:hypothetical protein